MEITSRLRTSGSKEVNAVLLNDSGEVYPVFLKSLHNTVIFPVLIESGYVLTSLPYGFVKDGVSFDQLPVQDYDITPEEEEMMYNSIGAPMPADELKKNITVTAATMAEPPSNYTIHTREELLQYLDATEVASSDDDFLPLNYFVAPAARYTIREFLSSENDHYVKLIAERRTMSLRKFHKLIAFLQNFGMPANYNAHDILDAYFAWGIDGLQFNCINRHREAEAFRLSHNTSARAAVLDIAYGFIDKSLTLLTPINRRNVAWTPAVANDSLEEYVQDVQMGKCKLMKYKANGRTDVTTLEGDLFNVRYNEEVLLMQQRTYPSLRVKAPVKSIGYLPLTLALPNNKAALHEYLLTNAIAGLVVELRKPGVAVSTYDALMVSGCNPETALKYVTTSLGLNRNRSMGDDAKPVASATGVEAFTTIVDNMDIHNFLSGSWDAISDDAMDLINSIIDGEIALDNIGRVREYAWFTTADSSQVANEIAAIHDSLGIPLEDIYNAIIKTIGNANYVAFQTNGTEYDLSIERNMAEVKAYRDDIQLYDNNNARDCTFFVYVTYVAREVGTIDTDRHVGIEFYFVNRTKKNVQEVLDYLSDRFVDKITSEVSDANLQQALLAFKNHFILNRYFELAFKGTVTWPKQVGGATERMPAELQELACRGLNRRIEMLNAFCNYTADCVSASNLTFNAFCVNAKITSERIIPRDGAKIKELPFYTLWYDWRNANPDVFAQLVGLNVLPPDFEAWEGRYLTEHFVERDYDRLFNDPDSLCYYEKFAADEVNSYDKNREFVAVAHPATYLYPGLYMDDSEEYDPYAKYPLLSVPREGAPVIRLGQMKEITQKDYAKYLHPVRSAEKPTSYIRKFNGFDAPTLIMVPNAIDMIPYATDKLLTVLSRFGLIYDGTTQTKYSYRDITKLIGNGYPVSQITGNLFLLRSADGVIWEVCI